MEPTASSRGISIVVPSYNSARFLSRLLATIVAYNANVEHEVLVIDDSNPEEAAATRILCEEYGVSYLWCPGNVARKRNIGIQRSIYEIVFFVDSDCELAPGTLTEHLKLYEKDQNVGAILGLIEFSGEKSWIWPVVERTGFLGSYSFARRMEYAPWGVTANLAVKRHVLQVIGGFDETFLRAPGGEDVDLGLRINKAGYKIACNPNAVVYHTRETWNTLSRMLRRVFAYGQAHYHVLVKHKDQVGIEYPRLAVAFFFISILLAVQALVLWSWDPLLLDVVFCLTVMAAQAAMTLLCGKQRLSGILREMVAHTLDLTFEWGLLYESSRHLDVRGLWAKIIYGEKQLVGERDRKIIQCWSLIAGFLSLLLLV